MTSIRNIVFLAANYIERKMAQLQGKGYGSVSIKDEVKCIKALLDTKPNVIVDLGGNVGDYSFESLSIFPSSELHIFEPATSNIIALQKRYKNNERVVIHPFAVSDFNGESILFSDEVGSGMASLSKRDLDYLNVNEFSISEKINVVKFYDYWKENCGKKIDVIKLDIEGHELSALHGMLDLILEVKLVQFEFGGCNIDTKTYYKDFFNFFTSKNFSLYRVTPIGLQKLDKYKENDEFFSTTNFIARNNRIINE